MEPFEFTQKMLREIVDNLDLEKGLADVLCKRIWTGAGVPYFTDVNNRDQAVAFVVNKLRAIAKRD